MELWRSVGMDVWGYGGVERHGDMEVGMAVCGYGGMEVWMYGGMEFCG
jgi:hypothetical protein